ncbi:unnamed protein product [Allacma fusca]|uniref:Uncharacterized protein n=1 Tax=Allacma fusca TaxID=39272 RepID=A0A8J2LDJ4_9HEXA|nr:unnamed protein product [Allacma fusca]
MASKINLVSLGLITFLKVGLSWKLQLCIHGSTVAVQEDECGAGVWFNEPLEISAACVDGGIWAVYESWCQERPFIWSVYPDRQGCMKKSILKKVLGIVYLGDDSSGAAISTRKQKLFLATEYSQKNNNTAGTKWTVQEDELDILAWGSYLHTAHLSSPDGDTHKCLMKGRHAYSASYSFPLPSKINLELQLKEEKCNTAYSHRWNSDQLFPKQDSQIQITISSSQETKNFHCASENKTQKEQIRSRNFKRNIENINFMSYSRTKDLLTPINENKVNEQTERLARKLIAHVFLDEPLPDVNFVEWKFLLMAEEIFDIACPHDMVPKEFFENILIFYRILLLESFDKFPPRIEDDEDTRNRIEESLKSCLKEAKPIVFQDYRKCSTGAETLKVQFEHSNGTTEYVLAQLPEKLKVNLRKFDVLLESAWKLMLFAHYYCADYFKRFPGDLSILQQRWQDLMAPDLLTRWQCPGKSYQMARNLLRMMNLPKTLRHVDHCIAAAHSSSVYSGWILRPVPLQQHLEGKSSHDAYDWNQSIYPVKQNEQEFEFYESPPGSRFPEVQWDKQTHCLREIHHPATLLGLSFEKCGAEKSN